MTVKSILALSIDAKTNKSTLVCAAKVARRFGSHITVTHIRGLPQVTAAGGFDVHSGFPSETLLREFEATEEERETQARAAFDEFVQREALAIRTIPEHTEEVSASWNVLEGNVPNVIALQGSAYDLIVAGNPRTGATSRLIVESALFSTGRPVVIAPPDPPQTLGDTVLIGWNRDAPAARAFHAAKALLLDEAKKVRLVSVTTGAKLGPSAEDIAANLVWNGISAEVREITPDNRSVGEVVLAEASDIGADLLVIGAYSHSRLREMIFGGVTQHVVTNATLPVFMAH